MKNDQKNLLDWYQANKRDLPWRQNRDPYRIWISETMLQQTTTTAVLGYYDRFLKRFPTLLSLAQAQIADVYEVWAGLGYYSRARNLHHAAQNLAPLPGFPKTFAELMEFKGFGPYTARAVSSLAFSEPVGVLDGNVIRVLSRKQNLAVEWWRPKVRAHLQERVDAFVAGGPSEILNQALMELGSQICTPKSPHCQLCPWFKTCEGRKAETLALRPLKKPRRKSEIWVWQPVIHRRKKQILLVHNDYAPFLKNSWLLPGTSKKLKTRPKSYDFRHSITHHDIFVQLQTKPTRIKPRGEKQIWVESEKIHQYVPASLVKKALKCVIANDS
jgi:A/G-specific adenine glycosylase